MFKINLEGFSKSHPKNQEAPKYPTVFDAEGHKISNGDYNFAGVEALYGDATSKMKADGDGEYDLKGIGGFIDINNHGKSVEKTTEEDEAVS